MLLCYLLPMDVVAIDNSLPALFKQKPLTAHIIGITGTKGKTTTTYLVKSILEHAGHKVGLIGTIETIIGDKKIPAENTTPESYILHQWTSSQLTIPFLHCLNKSPLQRI